ncbi:MAG TPA: hypothetical protein VGZ25_01115, partial [Gemmataceae bacterium]|nr:hypothetical protein [Gemmataceae bacterium]
MTRRMALALVVYSSWGIFVSSGQARIMPAPPSIPQRIALAEIVILGRVTHIEGQSVMVLETPQAKEKTEYFVAQVHIEETLKGADGLTDLKVAFPALPANWKNFRNGGADYRLQLESDQEVCLFLKPHHSGEFLV